MKKLSLLMLSIFTVVSCALFVACGSGGSNGAVNPAGQTIIAEGQDRGNGGETTDPKRGSAWFAEDTKHSVSGKAQKKVVQYCIIASPDFPITIAILKPKVQTAVSEWIRYLKTHRVFEDGAFEKRLTLDWVESQSCDHSDLKFSFGESDPATEVASRNLNQPWSMALRTSYDAENTWSKGVVWFAKPGIYTETSGATYPNWNLSFSIEALLLHEIGHVFGVGHVDGTIMAEDIVSSVKFLNLSDPSRRERQLTQIDQEFEVIPCYSCNANDLAYRGRLGNFGVEARNFDALTGRRPRGKIESYAVVGQNSFSLVVKDDLGSKVIPLDSLADGESSSDAVHTPVARIQIATRVERNSKTVWELNRVLSRSGTFERKVRLDGGSVVPLKIVLNMHVNPSLASEATMLRSNRLTIIWNPAEKPEVLFQTSY